MPECKEMARKGASGEMEQMGFFPMLLARIHMTMCAGCRRFGLQMRLLGRAFRAINKEQVDPEKVAALEKKVIDRLKN